MLWVMITLPHFITFCLVSTIARRISEMTPAEVVPVSDLVHSLTQLIQCKCSHAWVEHSSQKVVRKAVSISLCPIVSLKLHCYKKRLCSWRVQGLMLSVSASLPVSFFHWLFIIMPSLFFTDSTRKAWETTLKMSHILLQRSVDKNGNHPVLLCLKPCCRRRLTQPPRRHG